MKHLQELNLIKDDFVILTSHLCGQAYELRNQFGIDLQKCVEDIVFSYFNNLNRAISAYSKIYDIVSNARNFSDLSTKEGLHNAFKEVDHQILVSDFSYVLIMSLKSSMDMLACVIEFIEKKEKFKTSETSLTDIGKLQSRIKANSTIVEFYRSTCVSDLIDLRNQIAHRGYHITSSINPIAEVIFEQTISQGYHDNNRKSFDISSILFSYIESITRFDLALSKQNSIITPMATAKFNDYLQIFDFADLKKTTNFD